MADHLRFPNPETVPQRRQSASVPPRLPRNPRQHASDLTHEVQEVAAVPRRDVVEGIDPRHVFKVRATSRMPDSTWEPRGLQFLGEAEGWTYFVISESGELDRLLASLARYSQGPDEEVTSSPLLSVFGNIDRLEPYGPEDRRGRGIPADSAELQFPLVIDTQLWPSPDGDEASRRVDEVHSVVEATGGLVLEEDRRAQLAIVRLTATRDTLDALLELPVVEVVRIPPTPFIDPSDWLTADLDDLQVEVESSEPVGVLDDGVDSAHPLLRDLIVSERAFPDGHTWRPHGSHGIRVAGLAAYGDFEVPLRDGLALRGAPIHIARVLEPMEHEPSRTQFSGLEHRVVEEAIRALHSDEGVRVFNLSAADDEPYAGPHVSVWTETLDQLVRELGIVVVVAAGNVTMPQTIAAPLPSGHHILNDYAAYVLTDEARVAEPGIAATVLTVGSVARSDGPASASGTSQLGDRAVAAVDEVSPFTRSGPGIRGRAIKPDVVAYGGNIVVTDVGVVQRNNPGVGVISTQLSPEGRLFATSVGTSLAAPRVARLAADLWARYPSASANLIRAFVGVSTVDPPPAKAQFSSGIDRRRAFGHGRPSYERAAESAATRTTLYFDGSIPVNAVHVIPVPIPEPLSRGRYLRRFRVALAYDPPVRRQRREYIAGSLKVVMLRNIEVAEISRVYGRQPVLREDRADLITDRRRLELHPGTQTFTGSTLQVREVERRLLQVDDGDLYYLVVIHQAEPWANTLKDPYESQDYAIALAIEIEGQTTLDLRSVLEQRLRAGTRIRQRR